MSGPELLAAEAAATTVGAAEAASAAEAISAAIAAAEAEAAIIAAAEAAAAEAAATGGATAGAELFGGGALDPLQSAISAAEQEAAAINMAQAYTGQGLADPFEKFLRYGVDADAPGATMRSIQSGFANDPLNTLKSLPQYLGMSGSLSPMQTMYGASLAKQMLGGSGKPQSTTSTTQIRPGQQVNMSQPMSLLAPQIRRRRGISLI